MKNIAVSKTDAALTCKRIAISIAIALVFSVPFSPRKNIDMQGILLIISGSFALASLLFSLNIKKFTAFSYARLLIVMFLLLSICSSLTQPHLIYNLLGAPQVRLGSLGLASCVAVGLLCKQYTAKRTIAWLFGLGVAVSVISIPYTLITLHSLHRFGGIFAQADIMACLLGVTCILGFSIVRMNTPYNRAITTAICLLSVMLVLTETRSIIYLLLLAITVLALKELLSNPRYFRYAAVGTALCILVVVFLLPQRLHNRGYLFESVTYRTELFEAGIAATSTHPLLGYGPGNLADALACDKLTADELQRTCEDGYYFNSSHVLFLDRVLMIGWPGGIVFLALLLLALRRGFTGSKEQQIFAWILTLLCIYLLTNVTHILLELLLWVLVFQCLKRISRA
ncbi:MAG: O-antigen ligase family protein [Patescibacteria group bacterium]|nr:O-antigen ligase family protein [Patescibacteria group bacterium]